MTSRCDPVAPARFALEIVHRVLTVSPARTWQPAVMQIAMVGLGRMGANMVRRLHRAGHDCVAYDLAEARGGGLEAEGAHGRAPWKIWWMR